MVVTAVTMKNAVFWDVAPSRYFVIPPEPSVNKISTRRNIPEDGILHTYKLTG
jgi:hypothetical protein